MDLGQTPESASPADSHPLHATPAKRSDAGGSVELPTTQEPHSTETNWKITTTIPSEGLFKIHRVLDRSGWMETGKQWTKNSMHTDPLDSEDSPATTSIGKQLFRYLARLKCIFSTAPAAPNMKGLTAWQATKRDTLSNAIIKVGNLVDEIQKLATIGKSTRVSGKDLGRRTALLRDMNTCVIPVLIQTLWAASSLGGRCTERDGSMVPKKEGDFTTTTLGYVQKTTDWLNRLYEAVMAETSQRPFTQRPLNLGDLLKGWNYDIKRAVQDMDEKTKKDKQRTLNLRREWLIKEKKRIEKTAKEKESEMRFKRFCMSTHRIRAQINNKENPDTRYQRLEGGRDSGEGYTREASVSEEDTPPPFEGGVYDLDWTSEDTELVKYGLREHGKEGKTITMQVYEDIAYVLQKPLAVVMYQAKKLRLSSRNMARKRGQ